MATSSLPVSTPLRGIIVPMITPLRERDDLDVPGLERLIEHILDGGVTALFILGTIDCGAKSLPGHAPGLRGGRRYLWG